MGRLGVPVLFTENRTKSLLMQFPGQFNQLRDYHNRVVALGDAGYLDRAVYDRQRNLMAKFWQLYEQEGLKKVFTPEQQSEVVSWFVYSNTQLLTRGASRLGLAPLIVVVLIIAGASVSVSVSYLAFNALVDFGSNLQRQKNDLEYREKVLDGVRSGEIAPTDAVSLIKSLPETTTTSGVSRALDFLGINVTTIALIGGAVLVFSLLSRR